MNDPLLDRVRELQKQARSHVADHTCPACSQVSELAMILEQMILDDWSRTAWLSETEPAAKK